MSEVIVDNTGVKADDTKVRMDLVPPDALLEVGRVLTFGANKYGARNWERGMDYGRLIGAAMRHTLAIMEGEDRDDETKLLHSAHLACCAIFLCSFQLRAIGNDDRNRLVQSDIWKVGFDNAHAQAKIAAVEKQLNPMGEVSGKADDSWRGFKI